MERTYAWIYDQIMSKQPATYYIELVANPGIQDDGDIRRPISYYS